MGRQYNKVIKRRRRTGYLKRRNTATKAKKSTPVPAAPVPATA